MKRITALLALLTLVIASCKKTEVAYTDTFNKENIHVPQSGTVCGMEEAMASLSPEMKAALVNTANRTESQAGELLLFLDFDGANVVRGIADYTGYVSPLVIGTGIRNFPSPSLNEQEKQAIIALVKDDFSPFNIMVTTDQSLFDTYPAANKLICIVTTNPNLLELPRGVSGVAPFTSTGVRLPFNPCFVFANGHNGNISAIAHTISHESGHVMGLGHQHKFDDACNYLYEYHNGFGTGPLSFVPIMGSAEKRVSNWFAQPCMSPLFYVQQNDFTLLNSQVALRADDFPGTPSGGTVATTGELTGILEQDGDVDFIRINFKSPEAVTISSENIDLKVSVYNPGGYLMESYNDPGDTGVTIPRLNGPRYLKIEAAGNANMSSQFMTGQYTIRY